MALKGTFYGTTANVRITPIIEWSAVQSVEGNYSDVTATLSYTKKNSNPTTGGKWTGSLTIGEDTKAVSSQYIEVNRDKITQVMTHTVRVNHDKYGKASVTISATGGITNPSASSLQNTKISATVTLDTIPRASTVSCTKAYVGAKPTITITRADSSFTHTLSYSFGELKGTILEKTKETTIKTWTIPESFYTQIPKSKTGSGILTCVTYSGSTKIGTATCVFAVVADETTCKPGVTGTVEDTNSKTLAVTGDKNILVRYKSTALCTITAEAKKSASLAEKSIAGAVVTGNTRTITNVKTGSFLFRAKDSRGYIGEEPVKKTLVPYVVLTSRPKASRTNPTSGNAKITFSGSFFSGSFGAEENALTIRYRPVGATSYTSVTPKVQGNTYTAEVQLTDLDYTQAFSYEVVVADKLCTETATVTVGKGIPVFDWGENDFRFHVPVYLQEGLLADYVVAAGTESMGDNGTWYWKKWASGRAECYGYCNYGDVAVKTAWGSLFQSVDYQQELPTDLFAAAPTSMIRITATESGSGWIFTEGNSSATRSKTSKFALCCPVSATLKGARIGFLCKGRWK